MGVRGFPEESGVQNAAESGLRHRLGPVEAAVDGDRARYRRVYRAHEYVRDDPKPRRIRGGVSKKKEPYQ